MSQCKTTKVIECVPNFSEGRNKTTIDAIANAINETPECVLLDVDPGVSTNRTVYTFVGPPSAVVDGAVNAARVAYKLIDMRKHKGEHPRLGALDVCPFIPVRDVTIEDCVECSHMFAERLSKELVVPVYLYGLSQSRSYRQTMPQIRAGEYEKLPEKLLDPEWEPDYGSATFMPQWGATVTGCRKFLIAYNVNLLSTKEQAHRIALNIREQGRDKSRPGRLKATQAIGWWLDESNIAQVSINLLDQDITPLHVAYEEVVKDARELKIPVIGSEIVGLVPQQAILQAADYYIEKENLFVLEENQKVKLVIERLGLNSLNKFIAKEKIIEYILDGDHRGYLQDMSLYNFIRKVGARCAAPGGGTVGAVVGALGAALGSMVGLLTYGSRKFESVDSEMRVLIPPHHGTMMNLLPMVDADTHAFTHYMNVCKLPAGNTDEEREKKESAKADAMRQCVEVPLYMARNIDALWPYILDLAKVSNINTKSDLQVAARCLETAMWAAYYNVIINLDECRSDEEYKEQMMEELKEYVRVSTETRDRVLDILDKRDMREDTSGSSTGTHTGTASTQAGTSP